MKYKKASEILDGITELERGGLIKFVDDVRRGRISDWEPKGGGYPKTKRALCMRGTYGKQCYPHWCGTAACIGGYVGAYIAKKKGLRGEDANWAAAKYVQQMEGDTLIKLYYPPRHTVHWDDTAEQAAAVVKHLLSTGRLPAEYYHSAD